MADPILLVEDDDAFRVTVARHLRRHAFEVIEAGSSETAADRLRAGTRPALVLLDVGLPGETGWDLLRSGLVESAGSPPVVIVSALTVSPTRLREYHVAGYLPKPFPLETLVATVERLVSTEGPDDLT